MEKSIAEVQRSVGVKKCFFQKIAFFAELLSCE